MSAHTTEYLHYSTDRITQSIVETKTKEFVDLQVI